MGVATKLAWLFAVALLTAQRCASQAPTIATDNDGGVVVSVAAGSSVRVQRMDSNGDADGAAQELYTKDQVGASITAALAPVLQALQEQTGELSALSDLLATTRSQVTGDIERRLTAVETKAGQVGDLDREVTAIGEEIKSFQDCFDKGTTPTSSNKCATPYKSCPSDGVPTPTNAVVMGAGSLPGSSRKFSCKPGFEVQGAAEIHCKPSGEWETPLPSCKESNPLPKKWLYWRVSNAEYTGWQPMVGELLASEPHNYHYDTARLFSNWHPKSRFQMCFLSRAPSGAGCQTRVESRICNRQ